jgi:hypothetical protein
VLSSPRKFNLIGVFSITTEKENELIAELLQRTAAGKLRWGFQPPSTLTARRDGGKTEKFIIERKATEDSVLSQLYRLARA